MTINWHALGLVTVATLIGAIAVVTALSLGIRALGAADQRVASGRSPALLKTAGWAGIAVAGMIAVFGLYLIIPQFHR